jgi:hypothetical protein
MPYGSADTPRGLISWLSLDSEMLYADRLTRMLDPFFFYATPLVLPHIIACSSIINKTFLSGVDRASTLMESNNRDSCSDAYNILATHTQLISHILNSWINHAHQRAFAEQHLYQLLAAFKRAAALCNQLCSHPITKSMVEKVVTQNLDTGSVPLQEFDVQDTEFDLFRRSNPTERVQTPWRRMIKGIDHGKEAHACAAPDCIVTYADSLLFKRCGGCQRAIYCSRACQRLAWSHREVLHRAVCGTLQCVCAAYGLPKVAIMRCWQTVPPGFDEDVGRLIEDHLVAKRNTRCELCVRMPSDTRGICVNCANVSELLPAICLGS